MSKAEVSKLLSGDHAFDRYKEHVDRFALIDLDFVSLPTLEF